MDGYRREQTDTRSVQLNQGIAETALDEILYRPRFPCTALLPGGGAAFGFLQSSPFLAFPAAGAPMGRFDIIVPSGIWVLGTLTVRIVWTGDAASTNTVNWQVNAALTAKSGVPVAAVLAATAVAGPAVISALQGTTFISSAIAVNSSHILAGITFLRNNPDAYVGEARLLGFQLIYQPAAGH